MSEELHAKIAEQAREIERLDKDFDDACEDAMSVARQLAALKSNQGAVVLPEQFPEESTPELGWDKGYESGYNDALDEVTRLNASRVPEGWQLVPLNPAKFLDMGFAYIDAARESEPNMRWAFSHAGYKAMLSAAPAPAVEPASDEAFCDGHCTWLDHQPGCSLYEPAHSDVVKVPRELPAWLKDKHALGEKLYSIGWRDLADAQHCGVERLLEELQALLNGGRS
jgi:hypothetical protein